METALTAHHKPAAATELQQPREACTSRLACTCTLAAAVAAVLVVTIPVQWIPTCTWLRTWLPLPVRLREHTCPSPVARTHMRTIRAITLTRITHIILTTTTLTTHTTLIKV
jgi:hypothetical protein